MWFNICEKVICSCLFCFCKGIFVEKEKRNRNRVFVIRVFVLNLLERISEFIKFFWKYWLSFGIGSFFIRSGDIIN